MWIQTSMWIQSRHVADHSVLIRYTNAQKCYTANQLVVRNVRMMYGYIGLLIGADSRGSSGHFPAGRSFYYGI
jgi:hypothetical protein